MAKIKPNIFLYKETGIDKKGEFVLTHYVRTFNCNCHPETCNHFSRKIKKIISFKTY